MITTRLDLRGPQYPTAAGDIGPLHVHLAQLVGEVFQFARISYGDELTLHFGRLRQSRSPKLKDRRYGEYVLGLRGSDWLIKSGREPVMLASGVVPVGLPDGAGTVLTKADLEEGAFAEAGARVVFATPYRIAIPGVIGVQLVLSDGTTVVVIPGPPDDPADPTALADWEILTPHGLLNVGPGIRWEFSPHAAVA